MENSSFNETSGEWKVINKGCVPVGRALFIISSDDDLIFLGQVSMGIKKEFVKENFIQERNTYKSVDFYYIKIRFFCKMLKYHV